jgi:hypothetical protein
MSEQGARPGVRTGVWYVTARGDAAETGDPMRVTMTEDVESGARVDRYAEDIDAAVMLLRHWYAELTRMT